MEKIEKEFANIPIDIIKIHLKLLKYKLSDKPVLNYTELLAVIGMVLTTTFAITKDLRKQDYLIINTFILLIAFSFFLLIRNLRKDKYDENLNHYKETVRWCQFYEYILHKRGTKEQPIETKKVESTHLICKILNKIIG
ncbi:hypothetical protein [uncultured Apibacter sp.]|uniref:hypothetical protein n=1 Tax=uncultured Apibacter sp. TaxID=1778616 RepID=UPI0025FA320D|nr:hypothetical protein [uncultured Apibacter sp.]